MSSISEIATSDDEEASGVFGQQALSSSANSQLPASFSDDEITPTSSSSSAEESGEDAGNIGELEILKVENPERDLDDFKSILATLVANSQENFTLKKCLIAELSKKIHIDSLVGKKVSRKDIVAHQRHYGVWPIPKVNLKIRNKNYIEMNGNRDYQDDDLSSDQEEDEINDASIQKKRKRVSESAQLISPVLSELLAQAKKLAKGSKSFGAFDQLPGAGPFGLLGTQELWDVASSHLDPLVVENARKRYRMLSFDLLPSENIIDKD